MNHDINFKLCVIKLINKIPQGKVASYGQIASYIDSPRLARQVGWTLAKCEEDLPWWRVINNKGIISIKNNWSADKSLQKKLLEREDVKIGDDFKLDIEKYRWKPKDEEVREFLI